MLTCTNSEMNSEICLEFDIAIIFDMNNVHLYADNLFSSKINVRINSAVQPCLLTSQYHTGIRQYVSEHRKKSSFNYSDLPEIK